MAIEDATAHKNGVRAAKKQLVRHEIKCRVPELAVLMLRQVTGSDSSGSENGMLVGNRHGVDPASKTLAGDH